MTREKLERIRYVTQNYHRLRGLMLLPWALFFVLLGSLTLHPFGLEGFFVLQRFVTPPYDFIILALVYALLFVHPLRYVLRGYYRRRFGYVQALGEKPRGAMSATLRTVMLYSLLIIIIVISRPIGLASITTMISPSQAFGLLCLAFALRMVNTRASRGDALSLALLWFVVAVSFLPGFFYAPLGFHIAFVLLGVVMLLQGSLDHRLLVTTLKPTQEPAHEHTL